MERVILTSIELNFLKNVIEVETQVIAGIKNRECCFDLLVDGIWASETPFSPMFVLLFEIGVDIGPESIPTLKLLEVLGLLNLNLDFEFIANGLHVVAISSCEFVSSEFS